MFLLFQYVSISTPIRQRNTAAGSHLHSTMYLFQLFRIQLSMYSIDIYIPLCIYFNHLQSRRGKRQKTFTFHYVSISTISKSNPRPVCSSIYIPLCIYFNLFKCMFSTATQAFTFHYVSISTVLQIVCLILNCFIYIPLCIYFNCKENQQGQRKTKFTFHYVSISTPVIGSGSSWHLNLHSTMYLFQLIPHILQSFLIFLIYIPLCIYFNSTPFTMPVTPA